MRKLTDKDIEEILRASYECGVRSVQWTGGECTTLDLPKYVKLAKEIGYEKQALTTNAYLIGSMIDDLEKYGLNRMNISLDSLNQEKYQEITGVDGLETVKANIIKCSNKFNPLKINIALMQKNIDEVEDFVRFGSQLPNDTVIKFHELWKFKPQQLYQEQHVSEEAIYEKLHALGEMKERTDIKGTNPSIKYYDLDFEGKPVKIGVSTLPKNFRCGGPSCSKIRVYATGKTCEGRQLLNTCYSEKLKLLSDLQSRRCSACIQR